MLGQIRYPAILALRETSYLAPFQEALRSEYPELVVEQQLGLQISERGAFKTEDSRQWRMSTSDGVWSIIVGESSVALQSTSSEYTDYLEFRGRFARVWDAALTLLRPARRIQQGLRYVNHIESERTGPEWASVINPELLGPIGSPRFGADIEQAVSDIVLRRPDGQLKVKHGMVPGGPEATAGYLLDFDYFTQQRPDLLAVDEVLQQFDRFHELIYALFRWSIREEAFEAFEPRPEEQS